MTAPGSYRRQEYQLLLAAIGLGPSSDRQPIIQRFLNGSLDWDLMLRTARRHGVAAQLSAALKLHDTSRISREFLAWSDWYCNQTVWKSVHLTAQLALVVERLAADGIDVLPFKGPTLAALAFGRLGLREFSDLDVLVHQKDLFRVQSLLREIGYVPEIQVPAGREDAFLRAENALGFRREGDDTLLEVHWALTPRYLPFGHDSREIWDSRIDTTPAGRRIATLGPEWLLLYLCVHGAKHCWERLSWVSDVARLLASPVAFDWDRLLADAERTGTRRMLFLGLCLAGELLDAPIPDAVLVRTRAEPYVRQLAEQVGDHLASDDRRFEGNRRRMLFQLRMRERVSDRCRYVLHLATTPSIRDFESFRFPKYLSILYQFVRPLRLVRDYAISGKRS
jgi:hypothetical protein